MVVALHLFNAPVLLYPAEWSFAASLAALADQAAVRDRDTRPELALRSALDARGLRYRVHPSGVIGRPDLANRSRTMAVSWTATSGTQISLSRGFASMEEQFPAPKRAGWVAKLQHNIELDA